MFNIMKTDTFSNFKNRLTFFLLLILIFGSCKKDSVSIPQVRITEENSEESIFQAIEDGQNQLTLRPGPQSGEDVYVDKLDGQVSNNENYVPELPFAEWTVGGVPYHERSFIKFTNLSLLPTNTQIVSAKLFLYGMTSSLNSPQGNSYYLGSPYDGYGDNSCWVQQVVGSDWDETTLTYDNQPTTTTVGEASLAASTSQWSYNAVVNVTAIVKKMVANPSKNYGFCIKLKTEQLYRSIIFASSEATDKKLRPGLVVVFQ
jgi:hypothetical protein